MIRLLLALALSLVGSIAQAASPGTYDVTGVAANDVLNVRTQPTTSSAITGVLAPDAVGVEVLEISGNGRWGRISHPDAAGWASLRFLEPRASAHGEMPESFECSGTEPFWSLAIRSDKLALSEMSGPGYAGPAGNRTMAAGRTDRLSIRGFSDGQNLTAVIARQTCSDGMSDIDYPFTADVLISTPEGHRHLAGCCSR